MNARIHHVVRCGIVGSARNDWRPTSTFGTGERPLPQVSMAASERDERQLRVWHGRPIHGDERQLYDPARSFAPQGPLRVINLTV
jgi:hypothetical protein